MLVVVLRAKFWACFLLSQTYVVTHAYWAQIPCRHDILLVIARDEGDMWGLREC